MDTAGYPPCEASYGRDTRLSESIVIISILVLLSYQPYLSYRLGIYPIYRIRYTDRAEYPMEWIPAGRSTKRSYRIGYQMIPTRRRILRAGYPQVGVYHKPIYSSPPIISILSNLAPILQDSDLSYISYSIYQPGGVSYGSDTRRAE